MTDFMKIIIVLAITAIIILISINAIMDKREASDETSGIISDIGRTIGSVVAQLIDPDKDITTTPTPTATPLPYDKNRVFVWDMKNKTWVPLVKYKYAEPFYPPTLGPTAPPEATYPPPFPTPVPSYSIDMLPATPTPGVKNVTITVQPPRDVVTVTPKPRDKNFTWPNVTVTAIPFEPPLFADDFETGTTDAWSWVYPEEKLELPDDVRYNWDAMVIPMNVHRGSDDNGTQTINVTTRILYGSGFGYGISSPTMVFNDIDTVKTLFIWVFPDPMTDDEIALQYVIKDSNGYTGKYGTYNLTIRFVSPETPTAVPPEITPTPEPTITPLPSYLPTPTPVPTTSPDTMKEVISVYVFYTKDGIVSGVEDVPVYIKDMRNGEIVESGYTNATGYFVSKELPSTEYLLEGGEGWTSFGPNGIPIIVGWIYQEFEVIPP